ncbi:MAG TPA: RDD family protein [Thermoanaerobaculia bacterium]|nr:RDD family protein [Thermoanaerobaculia bacterium]
MKSTETRPPAASRDLADLPLRGESGPGDLPLPLASTAPTASSEPAEPAAPLAARAVAFAADLAGSSLAVTLALVAAAAATGRAPRLAGLPWAVAFGIGFSFVFVALPLTLFGRTVGMSLAGLAASPGASGRRLTPAEAARRWAGSLLAAASLGLALIPGGRDSSYRTPADRWSGRPLRREVEA